MKQKTLMIISIALSIFILIAIGGVVRAAVVAQKAENDTLKAQIMKLQVTYSTREIEYNNLIEKANQDIMKANDNMQDLVKQVQAAQQQAVIAPAAAPVAAASAAEPVTAPVSELAQAPVTEGVSIQADAAQQAALSVALKDSQLTKAPELVNFEGQTAYEVVFSTGAIYVGAQNGEILFNGTLPREVTKDEAAQIALKYLGGSNTIVQTDNINVNGKKLWRTIVAAGHMVYVDPTGQVTYVQMNGSAKIGG